MSYSPLFNIASSAFHTVMDVGESAISVASVPIGTAATGIYTMMGTGYMGLGFAPSVAMAAGGGAAVVALGLTSYWAYKSLRNVFTGAAREPVEAAPEKTALILHPGADPLPA
jgi:hypothetical protein